MGRPRQRNRRGWALWLIERCSELDLRNLWVGRFALHRLDGLNDRAGRGRKPWLPQAAVQQVVEQAVTPPPHLGAVELPHDGPRRRDLAGQRAAPVGGQ